ncbi:MAG: M20/M25/M40 family metallo-hydrolase [Bacteroidota bacterium]
MKIQIKILGIAALTFILSIAAFSQTVGDNGKTRPYENEAKEIMKRGLSECQAYQMLDVLTSTVGARLSGSPQAAQAVEWSKSTMEHLDFDNVHTEKVMVPHWVRGTTEICEIVNSSASTPIPLKICTLGGSVGTPKEGITAEVVEVESLAQVKMLGDDAKGKIIFFNRPFDKTKFNTFEMYGGSVDQRWGGAMAAARGGGVAALVRSMTSKLDDVPHTGAMGYNDTIPKVPTAALSTIAANRLSEMLKKEGKVTVHLVLDSETLPDAESANVMGELKGEEHPEEVVVIGGHLDSWDKGKGAHDDGAGCVQSIEALRILKELGLKPKRTIRAVTFMNEENGGRGGKAYAEKDRPGEKQIAAIESDAGGFTPRGFGVTADSIVFDKISKWAYLFEGMDAAGIKQGGGGSDIGPLGAKKVPLLGLRVDGQRYFDYHHSDSDTIDKVNERELELGAIAMAIMSYVMAEEGL